MHGHRRFLYDDPGRKQWQDPEAILAEVGLAPGMTFIDFGCGEGFFALPAAKMTGSDGRVYGIDISEESVNALARTALELGLDNLTAVSGPGENTLVCDVCADMVFFGIDLHDFADPAEVLDNARAMIKPQGRLVDLDWKKEPMELGPPLEIRFDEEKAKNLIEGAGFRVDSVADYGPFHYLITAMPI